MKKIEEGARVKVHYRLNEGSSEGPLVQETEPNEPLEFVYGTGRMLPAFEKHLEGLKEGDEFSFTLTPEEAYGTHSLEQIIDVPISLFDQAGDKKDELLQVGNFLVLSDQEGRQHPGKVLEVKEDAVKMDFNHAMAGKTLAFSGKVLEVSDGTES